jgi:hypothetical protein
MTLHRALLLLLCSAGSAAAQSDVWSGSLDLRNRWVTDVSGSSQTYRSVVNLGEGPRLFDADLLFSRPGARWADDAFLTLNSWGGDPYNTARFGAEKKGLYDLRMDYRNIAYFNNLPSFANPLLDSGVTLSQRAYDINRRQFDVALHLWPGRRWSPFANLSRSSGDGRGVTIFVSDADEFAVDADIEDRLLTARAGLTASGKRWSVTAEQGASDFTDSQAVYWNGDTNPGNRRTPFVGRDLALNQLLQQYAVDGSGLFSRAIVQAQPWSRLSLTGQFLYSQPKIDVTQRSEAEGQLVHLPFLAPYSLFTEQSVAQASRPRPSANWSTELRLNRRVRIIQSWYTDRLHVAASAAVTQLFNIAPELVIEDVSAPRLAVSYSRNQTDLVFEPDPRFSIRAGHRYVWGEAQTTAPEFDLRLEPKAQAALRRHVGLASAAARLLEGRLRVGLQAEYSPGSQAYFRTALDRYRRVKLRASYRLFPTLTLLSSLTHFRNRNDDPEIDLETESRQFSAGFSWAPQGSDFSVVADYTRSSLTSRILAIQLPFFGTDFANYQDEGHAGSLYLQTAAARGTRLKAGGSLFVGSGSRPTRFYTPQVELDGRLSERIRWVGEWKWYGFGEKLYPVEDFRTHTVSAGVRFSL